ncbi:MAG: hypothetical protein ACE5H3_08655 [Planctomycetota bacterium]
MRRPVRPPLALGCLVLLTSGCSTYYTRYRFEPRPAEAAFSSPGKDQAPRALFRVAGIRRGDHDAGRPPEVEIGVRLENPGDTPLALETGAVRLVTADLKELGPLRQEPEGPATAGPGETVILTLFFPLPPGTSPSDLDLDGLNLRWALAAGNEKKNGSIAFERLDPYEYGPYGYAPYGCYPYFYGGFGFYRYGFHGSRGHGRRRH